jgi:PLP dependent protein
MTLSERLEEVEARIAAACAKAGRDRSDVTLVAVTKTFPPDVVARAIEVGITDIGENRAQELKEKAAVLGATVDERARWHFIGHLQTNKVRQVVGIAALIHSVDRYGLAEAIARRARTLGITQQVLVEVNLAGERSKTGIEPERLTALLDEAHGLEGLEVRGLMAMQPLADDPEAARPYFRELAELGARSTRWIPGGIELSMGMTRDFEVAIEEGATLVRVGEAIFGPRSR